MPAEQQALTNAEALAADPVFRHSLSPMFVLDDDRRCVQANAAACLLLRQRMEEVRKLTLDDLTAHDLRPGLDAMWSALLQGRSAQEDLPRDMRMPDGVSVPIDLSVKPHIGRGRHLAIIRFPAQRNLTRAAGGTPRASNLLTKREREILTLVALGNTGAQIARDLFLSPATVQTHVVNALTKLGAKNRAHGIALALHSGELELAKTLLERFGCALEQASQPRPVGRAA